VVVNVKLKYKILVFEMFVSFELIQKNRAIFDRYLPAICRQ